MNNTIIQNNFGKSHSPVSDTFQENANLQICKSRMYNLPLFQTKVTLRCFLKKRQLVDGRCFARLVSLYYRRLTIVKRRTLVHRKKEAANEEWGRGERGRGRWEERQKPRGFFFFRLWETREGYEGRFPRDASSTNRWLNTIGDPGHSFSPCGLVGLTSGRFRRDTAGLTSGLASLRRGLAGATTNGSRDEPKLDTHERKRIGSFGRSRSFICDSSARCARRAAAR